MDFEEYVLIGVGLVAAGMIDRLARHTLDMWLGHGGDEMSEAPGKLTLALVVDRMRQIEERLSVMETDREDTDSELEAILERLEACEEAAGVE